MTTVSECVICGGEIRTLRQALVAPFVARRIWGRPPFDVALVECKSCSFLFYNPRLEIEEESRLYDGYRASGYLNLRHACEPWYTPALNASLATPSLYERRRKALSKVLQPHLDGRRIERVLDYGGAGGSLVSGLLNGATPFVYDISNAPAMAGVTSTSDPKGCHADLIVNSNVLEHVSFPRLLVGEMLDSCPAGGLMFVEVPVESPFGPYLLARRAAQLGWTCVARPALARSVLSTSSLYMMHEHINYYTERSLTELVRRSDCTLMGSGSYQVESFPGKATMAWCLAARA